MSSSAIAGDATAGGATHRTAVALLTAAAPLLAYNQPPSSTLLNQCLALGLWGAFVLALAPGRLSLQGWPLQAALLALAAGVLWSWGPGSLPPSMALSALGLLGAAMLLAWAGTEAGRQRDAVSTFAAFAWGLLLAGLLSVIVALIQVFAPSWADGDLIARSGLVGRAVGNLRQPNHLCSLLLWAVIAVVGLLELRRLQLGLAVAAVVALVFAVELSASRTGAAGLLLLVLWGVLGRGLSRNARGLLLATPLIYAASYGAMLAWGEWAQQSVGAEARLASGGGIESPNSRARIWANAMTLIAREPWTGVGFGEFNLAWSVTAFPNRPTAFFDHTHNLPLQLAVELGLPLAALVLALLATALVLAWRRSVRNEGERRVAATAASMMVLMIGLHSLVEYPLWYAYFLLPTAFAWGFALAAPAHAPLPPRHGLGGVLAGTLLVAGAALATLDYLRVVVIYAPGDGAAPLAERIERGQRSVLFDYHADYAAATAPEPGPGSALAFERAPHYLIDTRLLTAWARHLAASENIDLARTLAQRLREFRNAEADEFLSVCRDGPAEAFQCQAPASAHGWREFLAPAAAQAPSATQ